MRTAIAIMAFGILVQKFDLFLRTASESLTARALPAGSQIVGNIAGLLLIVLGGVVMAFAAIRFRETTRDIAVEEVRPGPGERLDITLVALRLPAGGDLVRLSGVHGNPLALSSARRSGRNSGADIAAAGHSRVRGSSIANVRCWVG